MLNTNGSGFANASSVTGLDFADDARGVAMVDWDHDGDLDIWLSNRTAPMVRYLESNAAGTSLSVAIKGTASAIGARATLSLRSGRRITRSVRAGDGYLSQSSSRLHFGWMGNDAPVNLAVHWPNGKLTKHAIPEKSKRLTVTETRTLAVEPSQPLRANASVLHSPSTSKARMVSQARPPIPQTDLGHLRKPRFREPAVAMLAFCADCSS